ncbi:MAG: hypothetical protein HLUCCA12_16240 [Rhodobacteraceae bacterium HLUCCA12]|nr:MAG: hypothetical protein HLUCCA12_16240 [Rhodobacteraceae bacterium HLUCCA12]
MGGFIKGLVIGIVSFVLGFAAVSWVMAPPPESPQTVPEGDDAAGDNGSQEPEPSPEPEARSDEESTDEPAETARDDPPAGSEEQPAPEAAEQGGEADPAETPPDEHEAADPAGSDEDAAQEDARAAPADEEAEPEASGAAETAPDAAEVPADEDAETDGQADEPETGAQEPAEQDAAESEAPEPEAQEPEATEPEADASERDRDADQGEGETATETDSLPESDADSGTDASDADAPDTDGPEADAPQTPDRAEPSEDAEGGAAPDSRPVLRAVPSSPGLDREIDGVRVGRLPSIVTGDPQGEEAPQPDAPDEGDEAAANGDRPARERFAAPYDADSGPRFAIVLVDAPADPDAEEAILALPMPVSVALDPQDADAPRRAEAYREAGHEILMLAAGLPAGATPSDLEVTFDGWFRALPEVVALIDTPQDGFQSDRSLAQAIMPFLADDGYGLVTYERGLNPAAQSADSAGIANVAVFRIVDTDDENQFTIRRYLDRATFRAQQQGHVVVMGRAAHEETMAGLIGWRMEGRAGQVAIVPVSATLELP